ncbi:MAG: anti-sigma factor domain-containing protein [Thermoanaerobacteraceae bacterium]|nr:anti-sigma factor domain-containing protein [Thermoanaerobacteraceae bacterium]
MAGKKGLVMSVSGEKAVVLTPEGEFKEYVVPNARVGEEVTLPVHKRVVPRNWVAAAALIIFLVIGTTLGVNLFFPGNDVYAYVSVDINPSLELAVSGEERVASLETLNDDGRQLLDNVTVIGMPVDQAVGEIVAAAQNLGYLKTPDSAVVLGIAALRGGTRTETELRSRLKQAVRAKVGDVPKVAAVAVGKALREEANSLGLSPGKYAIMLEAREQGLDISPESLIKHSIAQAIKQAGGHPGTVISRAEKDSRFKEKDFRKAFKHIYKDDRFRQKIEMQKSREQPRRKPWKTSENKQERKETPEKEKLQYTGGPAKDDRTKEERKNDGEAEGKTGKDEMGFDKKENWKRGENNNRDYKGKDKKQEAPAKKVKAKEEKKQRGQV